MTAAMGGAVAGGAGGATAAGVRATSAAGSAGARASRTAGAKTGRHAKGGQGRRDASQIGDLGTGFLAGKSGAWSKATVRPTRAGAGRLLVAEFVLCTIVLALSPLTPGTEPTPKAWMKKGTAICGLFIILGMVAGVGPKTERTMAAFGGVVTLALLINQRSIFVTIAEKFSKPGGETVGDATEDVLGGAGGAAVGQAIGGLGLR